MATWTASTRLRRAAEAVRTFGPDAMNMPMIPDAIEHAAPTMNAKAVMTPIGRPASFGTFGDLLGLDDGDDDPDHDRADDREDRDRPVLPPDEGDRALEDRAGHRLHLSASPVVREHPGRARWRTASAMMPAGGMMSWSVLASIRVRRSSTSGGGPVPGLGRGARPFGAGRPGSVASAPDGIHRSSGTLQAGGECSNARNSGSNPTAGRVMQRPDAPAAVPSGSPYTARLVSQKPAL